MAPFRRNARCCPACNQAMDLLPVGDDEGVDLCRRCGGAFMDFFDGEPSALAHRLVRGRMTANSGCEPKRESRCPECETVMHRYQYLQDGPEIDHCESCMGVFVSREQLLALSEYVQTEAPVEHHPLQRMARALKSLVDSLAMP